MSKAWSFFWLVMAWCIGGTIVISMIAPYVGIIALFITVVVGLYLGVKAYRAATSHRSHF